MSVVKIAKEAQELLKIWNSLTGSSIAFEIQNTDLAECVMYECKQGHGTRKGSWDDIPTGDAEECGTQHETIFSAGNNGGVVYQLGGTSAYFGLVWSDPAIGAGQYGYALGPKKFVSTYVEKWWDTFFTGSSIGSSSSKTLHYRSITVKIQPGFDPFKVTFQSTKSADGEVVDTDAGASIPLEACEPPTEITPDMTDLEAAQRFEMIGEAFLDSAKALRR